MNHYYKNSPHKFLRAILFLCFTTFFVNTVTAQTIRYVKPVASGNGTGTSWGNASNNLQAMITASVAGDQVWVAAGTYKPGTSSSARTSTFALKSGVKVYGSFAGNETSVTQRNISATPTILSGDLNGNDVPSSNPMLMSSNTTMSTNVYHVVTASGLSTSSVFDGFTITGGYANDTATTANGGGGGIYVSYSEGTFSNLIIKNCYAFFGGGIYLSLSDYGTPRFNGIWISDCSVGANGVNDGSAVYKQFYSGTPEFFNMVVSNCAGLTAFNAINANITNSTFYNLYTGSTFGNDYNAVVYGANMYNSIIGQHSLTYAAYNVSSRRLENNSFYGPVQEASSSYDRTDNITNNGYADFVDPANRNFRLVEGSTSINTGNNENLDLYSSIDNGYTPIAKDIAGNARQIGTVDRGAYEFGQTSIKYVKQVASGPGDGSSWENASSDLQLMINQAGAGDQIWVAKGTYKPVRQANSTAITPNNRDNTFLLKAGVKIYGSFAGGETTTAGRNFQTNATILSGDFMNNDPDNTTNALAISGSALLNENAYHVVVGVNIDDVVFDGFVLKGGVANGTGVISFPDGMFTPIDVPRDFGGGMHLNRVQGQFNNIAIRSSLASSGGGGIYNSSVSNLLSRFNGLIITGCLGGTTGAGKGSAIYVKGTQDSTVDFFNTLVTNCVGSSSVFVTSTKAIAYFSNATFYGVSVNDAAATTAGVIETASGGSVVFNNSIIGLHAYPYAFNIGWASGIASYSSNSSIYKTKTGQGTLSVTNNTTNTGNPGFINASAGDFGLTSSSSVRNLGNVAFLSSAVAAQYQYPAISKDIIGNPRTFQGNLDLGAYQYKPSCDIPDAPTAADQIICGSGTVANLTAVGTSLKWYLNQTGGSALSSSTTLSTRGYFVSQTIGVCESERVEILVTIAPLPAAPTASNKLICGSGTVADLTATGTDLKWYNVATGGTALAPTTALVSGTYYVTQTNAGGCESTRKSITVTVSPLPPAPTAPAVQTFCGSAQVSALVATGTNLRWYTAMTGGFSLNSNTSLTNGTYYVSQMGTSCESTRTAVDVVVYPMPDAPTASAQTFCGSGIVDNLVASGENHTWYDGSFNTLSGNTLLSNGTYYVTQTVNGCPSAATAVNVSILALPAAPTAFDQTLCHGATVASLTAAGTNPKWYASATGGAALSPDEILTSGTYYASQTNGAGCESSRSSAQITIMPAPPAPGAVALQVFCGPVTFVDLETDAPETKWYATLTGGTSIPQDTPLTSGTYYGAQMNMDCESLRTAVEVIVSPIPSAPTASSQTFCGTATVADLSATGDNLKWYASAIDGDALSANTTLENGIYYVSASNANCDSERTAVSVTIEALPAKPSALPQIFCGEATVANLSAEGTNLKWYATATGGDALSANTTLSTGTYYVSSSNANCESERTAVSITVEELPSAPTASSQIFCGGATVADLSATGTNLKWYASANGDDVLSANTTLSTGTYYVSASNTNCESDRTAVSITIEELPSTPIASTQIFCGGATVANLSAEGNNLKWYATANGGDVLSANTTLSTGTYYVSASNTNCESDRTAVSVTVEELPAAPTASSQIFCGGATVASLSATGTNLKWYVNATGGDALAANTILSTGTYYVSAGNTNCESDRTAVSVTVEELPAAPIAPSQIFCGGATVADLSATGTNLKWYATATGGDALSANTTLSTGTYYVSASNANCESDRTAVSITIDAIPAKPAVMAQVFCGTATIASIMAEGNNLKWYATATGGDVLTSTTPVTTGTYYVSQSNTNCEGPRAAVAITVDALPSAPVATAQSFCGAGTVAQLTATGTNLKWFGNATGGNALAPATTLSTGIYYVSQSNTNCESDRTAVEVTVNPIPAAPMAETQTFCENPAVGALVADGMNLTWYSASTGGTAISADTTVNAGMYYVSQTVDGCESARTAVTITIAPTLPAPVAQDQTLCTINTVADLVAQGINLKWYTQATGGTALNNNEPLVAGTYYVSQREGICESTRTAITVTLSAACTTLEANFCNTTVGFAIPVYATYVQGATSYRFRVTSAAGTEILERNVRYFAINNLASYNYGITYTVEVAAFANGVWSPYGPACTLTTPALQTTNIMSQYCGTAVSFTTNIYAEGIQYATAYRFRISDNGAVQYIEKPARYFTVNEIAGYTYGKTYVIDVAAMVNGQWGAYGTQCSIFTSSLPTTQLANGYCGMTMPTVKTVVYANGIPQATRYRFRITYDNDVYYTENVSRYFILTAIPGNTFGRTYTVEVAVQIGGQWGPYGNACTVSTPNAPTGRPGTETTEVPGAELTDEISLKLYPNPYSETFSIEMNTQSADNVTVNVFDMNGRLVDNVTIAPEALGSLKLGSRYQEGVYNVIVTQGSYNKTFKMVKGN